MTKQERNKNPYPIVRPPEQRGFGVISDPRSQATRLWDQFERSNMERHWEQIRGAKEELKKKRSRKPLQRRIPALEKIMPFLGAKAPESSPLALPQSATSHTYRKAAMREAAIELGHQEMTQVFTKAFERYSQLFSENEHKALLKIKYLFDQGDQTKQKEVIQQFLNNFQPHTWKSLCWFLYAHEPQLADPTVLSSIFPSWNQRSAQEELFEIDVFSNVDFVQAVASATEQARVLKPEQITDEVVLKSLLDQAYKERVTDHSLFRSLGAAYLSSKKRRTGRFHMIDAHLIEVSQVLIHHSPAFLDEVTSLALEVKYSVLSKLQNTRDCEMVLRDFPHFQIAQAANAPLNTENIRESVAVQKLLTEFLSIYVSEAASTELLLTAALGFDRVCRLVDEEKKANRLSQFSRILLAENSFVDYLQRSLSDFALQLWATQSESLGKNFSNEEIYAVAVSVVKHYKQTAQDTQVQKIIHLAAQSETIEIELKRQLGPDALDGITIEARRQLTATAAIVLFKLKELDRVNESGDIVEAFVNLASELVINAASKESLSSLLKMSRIDRHWRQYYEYKPYFVDPFDLHKHGKIIENTDLLQLIFSSQQLAYSVTSTNTGAEAHQEINTAFLLEELAQRALLSREFNFERLQKLVKILIGRWHQTSDKNTQVLLQRMLGNIQRLLEYKNAIIQQMEPRTDIVDTYNHAPIKGKISYSQYQQRVMNEQAAMVALNKQLVKFFANKKSM